MTAGEIIQLTLRTIYEICNTHQHTHNKWSESNTARS